MPTNINVAGAWKTLKQAAVNIGGTWHNANVFVNVGGTWKQVSKKQIALTISANTQNYNIRTAAGSPTDPCDVTLTINSGVFVGSTSTGTPALDTGSGWAANTTITIINNGTIAGCGGNAGAGGNGFGSQAYSGGNGAAGGNALNLQWPVTIQNTGNIFGGGGGGGGGGGASYQTQAGYSVNAECAAGGGGGGGEGYNGGSGAAPGQTSYNGTGSAGGNGSNTAAGNGGAGGSSMDMNGGVQTDAYGGRGGNGGTWGSMGNNGAPGYGDGTYNAAYGLGGSGGAAGKAINLNGKTATFTSGNNSTQVKGAMS